MEVDELIKKTEQLKRCGKCKEFKPITEFYKVHGKNYYQSYCKKCNLQTQKEYKYKKGSVPQEILNRIARERTEKECSLCKQIKPLSAFYKDKALISGVSSACKTCNAQAHSLRSKKNKEIVVELMGGKCQRCGIEPSELWPIYCFDLHHIDPTEKESINSAYNLEKLIEESKKCILLCANCHRTKHLMNGIVDIYCE